MAVTTVVVQLSGTVEVEVEVDEVQSAQVTAEVVVTAAAGVVVVVVVLATVVVEVETVQSAQVLDEATPAEAVEMKAATAATEAATFILMVGFGIGELES